MLQFSWFHGHELWILDVTWSFPPLAIPHSPLQFWRCCICKTAGHPVLHREGWAWAGLEAAHVSVSPGLLHRAVHETTDICCLQFWRLFRLPPSQEPLSPGGLGRLVTLTETCQWPEGGWGEGRITGWSHHCTGIAAVDWWSRLTTVSWQQNNILQSRWTDLTNTSKVMPAAFRLDSRVMLLLKYHAVA